MSNFADDKDYIRSNVKFEDVGVAWIIALVVFLIFVAISMI